MEEASEIGQLEVQGAASSPSPASGSSPTHAAAAAEFRLTGNKRGRAAASNEAIQGLREVAPPTDGSDCCAICLHDLDADAKLRAMPCSHAFHQDCIFQWLRRSAACPLCRHQLPTVETDEQVPMSRRVRYDDDGLPYMRISGNYLLPDDEEEAMLRQGLDRWMVEQHQQWFRSRSTT